MARVSALVYGVVCYLIFFLTFLYSIVWLGGFIPTSIDAGQSINTSTAVIVDAILLLAFALQHSVMARPAFKKWWTRYIPKVAERSTYVLFTCIVMIAMFAFWQPIPGTVWNVENEALRMTIHGVFFLGWGIILYATCLINHFDLFGLRQVWLYFRGVEYSAPEFRAPGAYKYVRHPLYIGWFTVFWATPTMGLAHWLFALGCTAYILIAIQFEERDLAAEHGESYEEYRRSVPMLLPRRIRIANANNRVMRNSTEGGEAAG